MADIRDMTREEIERYLASLPKEQNSQTQNRYIQVTPKIHDGRMDTYVKESTTEPSTSQRSSAQNTVQRVNNTNINQSFINRANESSYIDPATGQSRSYNKGSNWQAYIDKNITDPKAKADMWEQIRQVVSANPNMSSRELKYRLRAIEANLRRRYPNSVSRNFDISGNMLDSTMAKQLLSLGIKGNNQNSQQVSANNTTQVTNRSATPTQNPPATNDALNAAFKRIKNKQASDADLALFRKYSEEQLRKMGFGPISIAAIKGYNTKSTASTGSVAIKPTVNTNSIFSDDDREFMERWERYSNYSPQQFIQESSSRQFINNPANIRRYQSVTNNLRNNVAVSDDDREFVRQFNDYSYMQEMPTNVMFDSDPYKFIDDSSNKQRYKVLSEIRELEKKIEEHRKAIEANPSDSSTRYHNTYINDLNDKVQKLYRKINRGK